MGAHSLSRTARSARLRHLSKAPAEPRPEKKAGPDALPVELHPPKRSPDSNRGLSGFQPTPKGRSRRVGGAEGTRTPGPLRAKQVLFQLSYSPKKQAPNTAVPLSHSPKRPAPCDRSPRHPGVFGGAVGVVPPGGSTPQVTWS